MLVDLVELKELSDLLPWYEELVCRQQSQLTQEVDWAVWVVSERHIIRSRNDVPFKVHLIVLI